ncbi:MAG TPA: SagB/ThcOx family dehydrogenase [bacterium]|nr:SagB/ThcOx family dehydrogenase [bacterium]HQI47482.1 SagB/ThcOx family dehydrogenase [bacterium]HQJ65321.1 SagB/ThcOx family dehydrogenase [bacterium]
MKLLRFIPAVLLSILVSLSFGQQESPLIKKLPAPDRTGGKPLMQALNERHSTRSFSEQKLPEQTLSDLLWAAFGVNRADGRRTAPSARNWQEISLYLAMADGVYLYDAAAHALQRVSSEDVRKLTGMQDFVVKAPLNIVYVADTQKAGVKPGDDSALFLGADCGFIAENVYLYCASAGLNTVVRGMVGREALAAALKLEPHQKILLSQTVGLPAQ